MNLISFPPAVNATKVKHSNPTIPALSDILAPFSRLRWGEMPSRTRYEKEVTEYKVCQTLG